MRILLGISCLFLILTTASVWAQTIQILPKESLTLSLTKAAIFTCQADEATAKIQWFDNNGNEITATSGRVYVEQSHNSRMLFIKDIKKTDAGEYKCVSPYKGTKLEKKIQLSVFQAITFTHVPNPQFPTINTTATIDCKVEGEPKPVVHWKYNGKPVELGGRITKTDVGLKIARITQKDDGNYTCTARVLETGEYDERIITVTVHIPPKMQITPSMRIEGTQGNNAVLACLATGLPSPRYEFYKDKSTTALLSTDNMIVDTDKGKIEFRPLNKHNNGTYVCKAFNDVGQDNIVGSVLVNVPPKIVEFNDMTVAEKSSVRLICRSDGVPTPDITIRKANRNEGPYKLGSNDGGSIVVSNRKPGELELLFNSARPSDTGNYTCSSNNKVDRHHLTAAVVVEYTPKVTDATQRTVYSWQGRTRNISCEVDSNPPPNFRWLRNNREINYQLNKYAIYSSGKVSNLEVKVSLTDNDWKGDYMCEASNSRGKTDFKITLEEAFPPGKVDRIGVKERTPTMVLLTVYPPRDTGGIDIVGYRLETGNNVTQEFATGFPDGFYLEVPENFKPIKNAPVELRIETLKPLTTYTFKIRAKNEVGISREFSTINVTTLEIRDPYPVKIISPAVALQSHSYNIIWAPPQTGGRPVGFYNISYCKANKDEKTGKVSSAEPWKVINIMDEVRRPRMKYQLLDLQPETTYMLRVSAGNELTGKRSSGKTPPPPPFIFETPKVNPLQSTSGSEHSNHFGFSLVTSLCLLQVFIIVTMNYSRRCSS